MKTIRLASWWLCQRCGQLVDMPDFPECCMLAIIPLFLFGGGAVFFLSILH